LYSGSDRAIKICEKIHTFAPVIIGVLQTRLDNAAKDGMCRHVDARQLVLDIVSLNLCPYLAMPVVNSVLDDCMADKAGFLSRRKQENYDTIMRKLAP
ncbi:MAG: hypothetical protein K2M98_03845, partial [Muribaculum sp.]|nr:hypothetical protein [Muribaculum sp.]